MIPQRRNISAHVACAMAALLILGGSGAKAAPPVDDNLQKQVTELQKQTADLQKQTADLKGVIPKFAIPMREVGDRFQNMAFAAEGGNWGLAAYMSKYMNGAMKPASLTKPTEYNSWKSFYTKDFADVDKAITNQDIAAFRSSYNAVIQTCNACHSDMGYGFIKVVKMNYPADVGIDYSVPSNATDVPK